MLTIFWVSCVIYKEYMVRDTTINANNCVPLQKLENRFDRFGPLSFSFCCITTILALIVVFKQMPKSSTWVLKSICIPLKPPFCIVQFLFLILPDERRHEKQLHFKRWNLTFRRQRSLKSKEEVCLLTFTKMYRS